MAIDSLERRHVLLIFVIIFWMLPSPLLSPCHFLSWVLITFVINSQEAPCHQSKHHQPWIFMEHSLRWIQKTVVASIACRKGQDSEIKFFHTRLLFPNVSSISCCESHLQPNWLTYCYTRMPGLSQSSQLFPAPCQPSPSQSSPHGRSPHLLRWAQGCSPWL